MRTGKHLVIVERSRKRFMENVQCINIAVVPFGYFDRLMPAGTKTRWQHGGVAASVV